MVSRVALSDPPANETSPREILCFLLTSAILNFRESLAAAACE